MTDNVRGIWLMVATMLVFAAQDGLSRHLAEATNVFLVVMYRYWFFALFVVAVAHRQQGGIRAVMRTRAPLLQVARGALLALEICVTVLAFTYLGLIETHAVFACYPLLIAALSGPLLGERVGWRRWLAIGAGLVGVLIILQPGFTVFSPLALLPLASALMFALYGLLTRYAARYDAARTSFFWTGVTGALVMTAVGLPSLEPMGPSDSALMIALCMTGALGHWMLIRCYELAEASAVQPFAFLQIIFVSAIGFLVFGEDLRANVAIGAAVVVAAGVFTLIRQHRVARS